jgi:uncharacterized protein
MTVSLHSFIGIYTRVLDTLSHLLRQGVAFAESQNVSTADMLEWRLAEDMNPLSFQFAVTINFITGWSARIAGLPEPQALIAADCDIAAFEAAIAAARVQLDSITPALLEGRDELPITFKIGDIMEPTLPAQQWITGFASTNIHFHLSMVYAILRMKGVALGKRDLFPTGL